MRRREKGCIFWSGFIKAQFKVPFLQICHFKVMKLSSWRMYIVKNGGDSCPEKSGMGISDRYGNKHAKERILYGDFKG